MDRCYLIVSDSYSAAGLLLSSSIIGAFRAKEKARDGLRTICGRLRVVMTGDSVRVIRENGGYETIQILERRFLD